jgi:hypothetical protein
MSKGATITSALTTFHSGMTGLLAILALEAALPSSVGLYTASC